MGLGMGLTMSPMSTAAMNAVDRSKAGVASGTLSMSRMVGGTFGVAVLGALFTGSKPQEFISALSTGMTIGAVVAATAAGLAWVLIAPAPSRESVPAAAQRVPA